jgi:hypothetical protein
LGALSFHRSVARLDPLMPSSSSKVAWMEALRRPNSDPPQRATVGDTPSTLGSSNFAVLGNKELGLPRFP